MIIEWILIIVLHGNDASSSNIEFESKKACIKAKNFIIEKVSPNGSEVVECFKKFM